MAALSIDPAFAERNLNEGFSGGRRSARDLAARAAQPEVRHPRRDRLGLDIDALKSCRRVNRFARSPARDAADHPLHPILQYVKPDFVHVFVAAGWSPKRSELADQLESEGYEKFLGCRHDGLSGSPRCRCSSRRWAIRADFPRWPGRCATTGRSSTWTPGDLAEAGAGARRRARVLRAAQCAAHAARTCSARRPPRSTRARGPRSPRSSEPTRRGGVHQERHRVDQPGRLRAERPRRSRCSRATRS